MNAAERARTMLQQNPGIRVTIERVVGRIEQLMQALSTRVENLEARVDIVQHVIREEARRQPVCPYRLYNDRLDHVRRPRGIRNFQTWLIRPPLLCLPLGHLHSRPSMLAYDGTMRVLLLHKRWTGTTHKDSMHALRIQNESTAVGA